MDQGVQAWMYVSFFLLRLLIAYSVSMYFQSCRTQQNKGEDRSFFFGFTSGAAFHPYSTSELIELIILSLV